MFKKTSNAILIACLSAALPCCGCSGKPDTADQTQTQGVSAKGDHSGWWCPEHGIPESECSMCSAKAAAEFKAKGDWCEEHNRAESQCFKCDPSRAEKFAKLYEAKFGHAPPKPTE